MGGGGGKRPKSNQTKEKIATGVGKLVVEGVKVGVTAWLKGLTQ